MEVSNLESGRCASLEKLTLLERQLQDAHYERDRTAAELEAEKKRAEECREELQRTEQELEKAKNSFGWRTEQRVKKMVNRIRGRV